MQKIEAVIQPSKLDALKDALLAIGVEGMTILEARGHGRQKGHTEFYRGREYTVDLLPKIKIETVVPDELLEKAVQAIITATRTGKIGDGKIFVSAIDEAIRIRNDERGPSALYLRTVLALCFAGRTLKGSAPSVVFRFERAVVLSAPRRLAPLRPDEV